MKFAELFAGIGGFRYGLEACNGEQQEKSALGRCGDSFLCKSQQPEQPPQRRNYTCVWANEFDRYASAIYRYNYGEINEGDIRAVDPESIPDFDLLTFGWPCQDNSIAGQRAGQREGTRSGLLAEAVRILRVKKPDYFLAENVLGLFSVNDGYDFYETIRWFTEIGYDVQWQVLNTRWFLPQNRERIYFVGHSGRVPRPQVFPIGETNSLYSETDGEVATALDVNYGKGWLDHGQRTMVIDKRGTSRYSFYQDETGSIKPNQTGGADRVPMVMNRGNYRGMTEVEQSIRRLTPVECERLQGFPDNFTKYGLTKDGKKIEISDTQRYKVLGNAVSTSVVSAVGARLNEV